MHKLLTTKATSSGIGMQSRKIRTIWTICNTPFLSNILTLIAYLLTFCGQPRESTKNRILKRFLVLSLSAPNAYTKSKEDTKKFRPITRAPLANSQRKLGTCLDPLPPRTSLLMRQTEDTIRIFLHLAVLSI